MHLPHRLTAAVFLAALACPSAIAATEEPLPKAENILDKFVEATGGKAAYEKIHNEKWTGTLEFLGKGIKGVITSYRAEPNKTYTRMEVAGVGAIEDGTDGETAWTLSVVQGPHIKQGDERAATLREAVLRGPVQWRTLYKQAETAGVETIDDQVCYKVVLTPNEGKPETHYYGKKSNLLVKVNMTVPSPMGEVPTETIFKDYKDQNGLFSARQEHHKALGQEFLITIDRIEYNIEIPKNRFDLPAEIKALTVK